MSTRKEGRFLHLGQVIVDFALTVDHLPERGGDIFANRAQFSAGGGYNVLYAARQMGADSYYVGATGDGPMADIARTALHDMGVHSIGCQIPGVDTGISIAMTEPDGERSFVSTRGAETMVPHDFYATLDVTDADIVYLSGYSFSHVDNRTALEAFAHAHADRTGVTVLDIGPMVKSIPDQSLRAIALLHPFWSVNERESALLCERFHLDKSDDYAARCQLLAEHLKTQFLLRAGAQGAWYCDGRAEATPAQVLYIPTPQVIPVDTNGAGDAHTGVLCAALLEGLPLRTALLMANCAGALSTQQHGPATCPDRAHIEEICAKIEQH
ncbi:PfkB family carbohydrate kinase [Alloscardovia criceti]|uniref:PfkB family carbohydrate kinase n=1 Tax=Alloscardovia criceti TaxID=356828 RepID=UPI000380C468|nr:PfkB family carbohydrate kinase [Alloscardovia criceti]